MKYVNDFLLPTLFFPTMHPTSNQYARSVPILMERRQFVAKATMLKQ